LAQVDAALRMARNDEVRALEILTMEGDAGGGATDWLGRGDEEEDRGADTDDFEVIDRAEVIRDTRGQGVLGADLRGAKGVLGADLRWDDTGLRDDRGR
jgi:hypothetical protein